MPDFEDMDARQGDPYNVDVTLLEAKMIFICRHKGQNNANSNQTKKNRQYYRYVKCTFF